jgi:N-glycosidase YbiA
VLKLQKYELKIGRLTMNEIKFYRTNEEYGFLSNFAAYKIFLGSFAWPTTEHFFQAYKFTDYRIQDRIRQIESPMEAASEGRKRSNPIRPDWETVRDDVMRRALRAKFLQHRDIRIKLLNTGNRILIEHTANDNYWADGGDGSGKNMLGILLMELRADLKNISPNISWPLPPWIAFDEIDPADMFWRMGIGEGFIDNWVNWYNIQPPTAQSQYRHFFAAPESWKDFYD